MAPDPYQVLGLPSGAPVAEVKRAYRRLAKVHHPDSAGEGALPRFLEIQRAYEQLTAATWRPGSRRSPTAEPWRADPARARSTPGAQPPGGTASGSGTRARSGTSAGAGTGTGAGAGMGTGASADPRARARAGTAAGGRAKRAGDAKGDGPAHRRRTSKKATFGSTTYDEAHDPADPTWSGASWYGPTSGEYWQVNPREYADPRKHGPEYLARAAARAAERATAAERAATAERAAAAERSARASTRPPASVASRDAEHASPPERNHREPPPVPGWTLPAIPQRLRRLVLAVVAWPPLGIAAAALIGEATGCAAFSASCISPAELYPWLAQALILGLLLALPLVAQLLAGGTIAVALLALPATAALSAVGATYDRTYGPASLIVVLAAAWVAGVGAMFLRRSVPRTSP